MCSSDLNRYVRLLALGAKPERIAALTFTRKAAGEFFDEILKKLAGAADNETVAKKLAAEIGVPALRAADFLKLLRGMTEAMHRLNLGTLDSFFARVVRAFPLELGLAGDFEVLQEHAARLERRRVLRRMFAHTDGGTARQDFIEASVIDARLRDLMAQRRQLLADERRPGDRQRNEPQE